MPFSPLPATFLEDLARCGPGEVLELGSGHGAFTAVLAELGCRPVTLDRAGLWRGEGPDVVGDALAPPLRTRFRVVVAANLVRHLWPRLKPSGPGVWQDLVAPGGSLWLLEDEPCKRPQAARNYRDLQDLLAALQPLVRGPLLPQRAFLSASRGWPARGTWTAGQTANTWPADVEAVEAMLLAGRPAPGGPVASLLDSLARVGLSYGRYWWARWIPEASA
ncbi:MAG: class I SAM-dependent methyltransferase [Candidatus Krumholzibacteriia bacterium]